MQNYLFIGGNQDGLLLPAPDEPESIQLQVGVTDREAYLRETLTVADMFVTIYRHQNTPPKQVLTKLIDHYRAWAVNRPGGL